MQAKSWLTFVSGLTVAACLLVAGINYAVDPWGLNETWMLRGFNANKPDPLVTARLHKAYGVMRLRPAAVAMGTSTVEHGISVEHPAWRRFGVAYNLGFPGANIGEIKAMLEAAHRVSPLKHATIGLDLFSFNAHRAPSAQTAEAVKAMQSATARVQPYFTRGMLADSVKTVRNQASLNPFFLPDGQSSLEAFVQWHANSQGHFNLFAFSCRQTVRGLLPKPEYRFEFQRGREPSTLDQFRELLEFAQREGIELQLFFSPYHAWQYETMRAIGAWPFLELLKQQLARLVEPYAHPADGAPRPRVTLWDFADFSAVTSEDVPEQGDIQSRLRWTWDGQHYMPELGDLMQDRMSGLKTSAATLPDDFGVMLNAQNVNAHLLKVRERQQLYRESHKDSVATVEGIAARTLRSWREK